MRFPLALRRRPNSASGVIDSLYTSLLGRQPRGGEELSAVRHLKRGGSLEDSIPRFLGSPELQDSFYRNPVFWPLTAPEPLPPDEERLYFCHVPKTGGTSLTEMLRKHFTQLEFCGGLHLGELFMMSNYRLRSFRVIAGHCGTLRSRGAPAAGRRATGNGHANP